MATFFFRAVATDGKLRTGSLTAENDKTVTRELRKQGLTPIYVGLDQKKPIGSNMTGAEAALPIWMEIMKAWIGDRKETPQFPSPGNIVFVTIDPAHDGPKEVGQYAGLFGAPIIGLTGTQAQIDQVKKQYGIFAQPSAHAAMGKEMEHTATVLLFGRDGRLAGTISPDESDSSALAKIRTVIG